MIKSKISFGLILLVLISCGKEENHYRHFTSNLPLLFKTLDSTISNQREDRVFYYYGTNGNCDSIIWEIQDPFSNTPFWSRSSVRFEYNNNLDTLPRKIYRTLANAAEHLYSIREYNNLGKVTKYSLGSDTFKCTYDVNNRMIADSQFSSFNVWQHVYIYGYDIKGNVSSQTTISSYGSGPSPTTYSTFDSSKSPYNNESFNNRWNPTQSTQSININNPTSHLFPGSALPYKTTYLYNSYNLPYKAYYFRPGASSPYKTRTYFYQ